MQSLTSPKTLLALAAVPVAAYLAYSWVNQPSSSGIRTRKPEPGRKIKVTQLVIYPLKSAKGISVDRAELGPYGFKYDRQWMIVSAKEKRFISQRQVPKLALLEQKIENGKLVLSGAGMSQSLALPLDTPQGLAEVTVTLWNDTLVAFHEGDEAAKWISEYLADTARSDGAMLVRLDPQRHQRVLSKDQYAVKGAKNESAFSDGYPLLLMNTTSLEELNRRLLNSSDSVIQPSSTSSNVAIALPSTASTASSVDSSAPQSTTSVVDVNNNNTNREPLRWNRFRPNIIVTAPTAFEEGEWMTFRIGAAEFDVVKPCDRCKVTTIHQESGTEQGPEPLRTLATFRSGKDNRLFFCENLIHKTYNGFVSVGDEVELVSLRCERHSLWNKNNAK